MQAQALMPKASSLVEYVWELINFLIEYLFRNRTAGRANAVDKKDLCNLIFLIQQ